MCCRTSVAVPIQPLGLGLRCDDNATGRGYIMYTVQAAVDRFSAGVNDAQHFVCVQFSLAQNSWIYVGEGGVYSRQPFALRGTDFILAQFDFGNASSTITLDADKFDLNALSGMRRGSLGGDLSIQADMYNGTLP